jgi:ATP-dependent exoDNAse (exonuclease V) beta subunit
MKNRIIKELYHISSGRKSPYILALTEKYRKTDEQIRLQARKILIHILHDYTAFNISTIDHFFQQTMRAFIREIGLQGNYRIEMDKDLVLSESIDNLLSELDQKENKELLEWLLRFSEDKVEKGETWDLRNEIKALGNELFNEKYKVYSKEISKDIEDKQALSRYKNTLFAMIRSTETEAKQIGEQGIATLDRYGLQPSDFKGGSRSALFFFERLAKGNMKEPSDTFISMAGNLDACYTKTTPPDKRRAIEDAFDGGLNDCIQSAVRFFENLTPYYTAREIVHYYYTLGILTDISRQINAWREDKNCMLIADTTELLNKVIDGSDVPFIYEKTGTHIDHYMIDEFQDTSEMQWHNFRPLVRESLAYQRANLIVGDIKQSIYRFRNSDWTLLDEQVKLDFSGKETTEKTLTENWRSLRHIVEFNNTLFTVIPELLQIEYNQGLDESSLSREKREMYATKIVSAYDRSFQRVAPPFQSKDGHVRIEFLPEDEETGWKDQAMERIPPLVERLQENGYALRDIAVLVRTRAEGMRVAETLLAYGEAHRSSPYQYDIISEDALIVGNSSSVRFIISMLQYLRHPDDPTVERLAQMAYAMMRRKAQTGTAEGTTGFNDRKDSFPPETLWAIQRLSHRSFYETVEGFYRLFELEFPANEQIYIQAFLDIVAEYTGKEPTDTDKFLNWWAESGYRAKIATPDSQNAIRILTIHKSKGLGFKVVIIPFGDWDVDQKSGSILWCHPQEAPFNQLHLAPVGYSKTLNKTYFAEEYYHEKLHAYIDNLNALYVAFTRAKEELIVFSPGAEVKRTKIISRLLRDSMQETGMDSTRAGEALQPLSGGFHAEDGFFEWGDWWHPAPEPHTATDEVPMRHIPSVLPDERLHLRLHRKGGFFDDKQRRYGILMHDLLSRIQTKADIRPAVKLKEATGEVNPQEAGELIGRLESILETPDVKKWFDGSMTVMNEAEILFDNGNSRRPDRVMMDDGVVYVIDYKFGEHKDAHYRQQIKRYRSLICEMGYQQVNGSLWYVERGEIETV